MTRAPAPMAPRVLRHLAATDGVVTDTALMREHRLQWNSVRHAIWELRRDGHEIARLERGYLLLSPSAAHAPNDGGTNA